MIKEYIEAIVANGKAEDMDRLSEMLQDTLYEIKDYNYDEFCDYKMELYEMAYGKTITREMAENWVNSMRPSAKWDFETTSAVKKKYNLATIDDISFYVVMNMLYSDMHNILGDGDDEEGVIRYIEATKDWLNDEDIGKDKLYNYWKYVAK